VLKQFIAPLVFFILSLVFLPILNPINAVDDTYNGSSNFDVSQYRTYNTKSYTDFDDKFYITPIKNVLQKNNPSDSDLKSLYINLRMELALTGYESYCMAEKVKIKPEYSTQLIDRFLELNPQGINLNTSSNEILGMESANYPIWRDLEGKQFLMNSLEEYFGFKDVYEEDAAKTEINTAAINSLLSQEQSCVQGWITLGAERRACNRLQDSSTCEFTKRKIPGTDYEVHDIMSMLSDFTGGNWAGGDPKVGEELAIKWCDVIFSEPLDPNESKLTTLQKGLVQPIRQTIINVPTYIDKGYRYGFIVAAIETRIPGETSGDEATLMFNFFTPQTKENQLDEVLVVAFKLPDIGTNKGPYSLYGHEKWNDPLDLTRLVLTNNDSHKIQEDLSYEKRETLLNAAIAVEKQTSNSKIYCYNGIFPSGSGSNSCNNPLPRALTDIINGATADCETKIEIVNEVSDLAGLRDASDTYGKLFTKENGGQVLLNLFRDLSYNEGGTTPDYASISPEAEIQTIWTIKKPIWEPSIDESFVHFYLVYPVGFELATIEEAIKGTFFTKTQIAEMDTDESIANNFEVTGQTQTLSGGNVGWSFEDYEKTANWECGPEKINGVLTGNPKRCIEHPTINIAQDRGKIDVLGGKLSWWLRKVQVALSAKVSFAHSYYESCKTMEEFLLGKCGGNSSSHESGSEVCTDIENVKNNIDDAIDKAAQKWGELFPIIGSSKLAQMMKEIYAIEGKIAVDSGDADWCTPNEVTATGPFQIKHETYKIVTNACPEEWQDDGLDQCDNDILNRCDPYDAADLAIRTILFSGGAWRYGDGLHCGGSIPERSASIVNYADLYKAVCNYGEGDKLLPHLGNVTYCQYIFERMGWKIP